MIFQLSTFDDTGGHIKGTQPQEPTSPSNAVGEALAAHAQEVQDQDIIDQNPQRSFEWKTHL